MKITLNGFFSCVCMCIGAVVTYLAMPCALTHCVWLTKVESRVSPSPCSSFMPNRRSCHSAVSLCHSVNPPPPSPRSPPPLHPVSPLTFLHSSSSSSSAWLPPALPGTRHPLLPRVCVDVACLSFPTCLAL